MSNSKSISTHQRFHEKFKMALINRENSLCSRQNVVEAHFFSMSINQKKKRQELNFSALRAFYWFLYILWLQNVESRRRHSSCKNSEATQIVILIVSRSRAPRNFNSIIDESMS